MFRLLLISCWLVLAPPALADASIVKNLFGQESEPTFLQPEQAFGLNIRAVDAQTLLAEFRVTPGYYLYRERTSIQSAEGSTSQAQLVMPKGDLKNDLNFGETEVYHTDFTATVRLNHAGDAPKAITLLASYQGCSEQGLCYAPIRKTLTVALDGPFTAAAPAAAAVNETDQAQSLLQGGKLWLVALGFFGFGLLLALTPCVFPLIPILSGIIVGQGRHPTRMHAFNLSLAYTLGMAVSYTLAGVAAAFSGHLISNALQNPWALGTSALVFVALALSMFGLYELRLPSGLESSMVNLSNRFKGGRFAGVFAMGALSALIVSPCVAAPLAGALLYIGQTHDVLLGAVALFALSLGMGMPLLALGASAGALLPKAGAWMNDVRNFFGVVMLGMAVWLIGPVIPAQLQLGLWAALLIVPAIYMHALDSLPPRNGNSAKLWKGIGIMMLVGGIALLLGALSGSHNPLQPLAGLRASAASAPVSSALGFQRVQHVAGLDAALQQARGKYVMLDFYADWCVSCKEYEQFTFRDPRVAALLKDVVLLQADVTQNNADDAALLKRFDLFGPPGIIFFDQQGNEIPAIKVVGYQDADKFLVTLNAMHTATDGTCAPALEC
jgi:thiol:disulfide interchange protein DsbD